MRTYTTIFVAALAAVVVGVRELPAQSPDLPTVAVMDFTGLMLGDAGNSVNVGKAVSAMLVTEFSIRDGLHVIERSQLQALLEEQRLSLSGAVSQSRAIEIGKLLGAQYVFFGAVVSIMDNLRIDIRAVDTETSEIVSVMKKMDKTSELIAVVISVADDFGEKLDLTPPSGRPEVAPIPVAATIAYSRAVDFEDRGDSGQAIAQYERALELYPDHRDAQRALTRLRGGE